MVPVTVSTFEWPAWIPAGHRSVESGSSNITMTVRALSLIMPDESIIDVFDDIDKLDGLERMSLICAAAGTPRGIKDNLPAGYVLAAALNAPDHLRPDDPTNKKSRSIKDGKFKGASIEIRFDKVAFTFTVDELMSLTFLMAKIVSESSNTNTVQSPVATTYADTKVTQEELQSLFKK